MTPREQIADLFRRYPIEGKFEDVEAAYRHHGYVFDTPEVFLMGMQVKDGWFVHSMAGDLQKAIALMPHDLPWISFCRYHQGKRRLAIYRTVRLKALCTKDADEIFAPTFTD